MKIVTENYAETLGSARERSDSAFLAAVIGQGLRADLDADLHEVAALPDHFLVLVQTLDARSGEPAKRA
ncbi:MAG: hypothetical protein INR70_07795 [Parafilimonas terrae]|nr:hypothetical protein [Parafilimonas terrae]